MKGYIVNLENKTISNDNFREVLYTGKFSQLVLMSLLPGEEIGLEVHSLDQFIRVEKGMGVAILDGVEHQLSDGSAVIVPAGANHNIINTSATDDLKLYTIYSPPEHQDGVKFKTKVEAESANEHFNGQTTE